MHLIFGLDIVHKGNYLLISIPDSDFTTLDLYEFLSSDLNVISYFVYISVFIWVH